MPFYAALCRLRTNQKKWLQSVKKKFKHQKVYTIKDKIKFEDVEYAIVWNLPDSVLKKLTNS